MGKRYHPDLFWSLLDKDAAGGCWLWPGNAYPNGYGRVPWKMSNRGAHRLAWVLTHGSVEEGLCVLHHCDVKRCCNPAHLYLGTPADNGKDRSIRGQAASGDRNGSRLHPERLRRGDNSPRRLYPERYENVRGARHYAAKFSEEQVLQIRADHAQGMTIPALAEREGVTKQCIRAIVTRQSWAWLPDRQEVR